MSLMDRLAEQEKQQKAAGTFDAQPVDAAPEEAAPSIGANAVGDASLLVRSVPTILSSLTHPVNMVADFFGIQHKGEGVVDKGERAGGAGLDDERPVWRKALDLGTLNIARDLKGFYDSGAQFRPMESGLVRSVTDIANMKLAKEHPVLYGLNLVTTAADIATVGESVAITAPIKKAAFNAVLKEAASAGIDRTVIQSALRSSATRSALNQAVKTGERGLLDEVLTAQISKLAKVDESVAQVVARRAADIVSAEVTKKATLINAVRTIEHPFRSAYGAALGPDSVTRKVLFGTPEKAAVTKLYGKETVMKDPDGYLQIEQWAEAQAKERGLPNTVESRLDMMRDWAENEPGYAALKPDEQVAHFKNYASAQAKLRKIHELYPKLDIIATRALDETTVKSMVETLTSAGGLNNYDSVVRMTELLENFGKDFEVNKSELLKGLEDIAPAEARKKLVERIGKLGSRKSTIDFSKWSPEVQALAKEIEGTGYRAGRAPKNKAVSYADNIGKDSSVTLEDLAVTPNPVGRVIDALGLSTRGAPQSAEQLLFQQSFNHHVLEGLPDRVKVGGVSVPTHKLYDWLDRNRKNIGFGLKGESAGIRTVFDIKANHLRKVGFDDATAKAIADALGKAKRDIPTSIVGAGEKVLNHVRTRVPGFDRAMTTMTNLRFGLSPAFAAQEFIETTMSNTMLLGGDLKYFVKQWADAAPRFADKYKSTAKLTVDFDKAVMVQDDILSYLGRTLDDFQNNMVLSAEGAGQRAVRGVRGRAKRESTMVSRNYIYRAAGQSAVRMATNFSEALAAKFGMTLDEALAKDVIEGAVKSERKVVYKNPALVKTIRDAVEQGFHYKKGFLTSPLIKTLNVAFYPFRFQAKATSITAKFFANLPPGVRMTAIHDLTETAAWLGSPDGEDWRTENHNGVLRLLDYVTAHEGVADTIEAVFKGEPFNGKAGRLGGIPLGFVSDTLRAMALLPNADAAINKETGKPYQRYQLKEPLSEDAAKALFLNFWFTAFPSTYASALTGGLMKKNYSSDLKHEIEKILGVKYEKVR